MPSPPTCWKMAPTPASSRCCSATAVSRLPPGTRKSPHKWSRPPSARWTAWASQEPKRNGRRRPSTEVHAAANLGVGRHLSTARPRLPPVASLASAPAPSHASHRELPDPGSGRGGRMVRPLPVHAYPLSLLPQSPLPQVSRGGARQVAGKAHRRTAAGGVFSRRLYAAGGDRRNCFLQSGSHLRSPLRHGFGDTADHCPRPETLGGGDRLFRRPSYLGAESSSASSLALCGPGRRALTGRSVGGLPSGVLPASARAQSPFSPSLSGRSAHPPRRGGTAIFRRTQ